MLLECTIERKQSKCLTLLSKYLNLTIVIETWTDPQRNLKNCECDMLKCCTDISHYLTGYTGSGCHM